MFSYIKNSFEELKKVSWPTFNQLIKLTVVVLIFTTIFTAVIGVVDYVLNQGYQQILEISQQERFEIDPSAIQVQDAEGNILSGEESGISITPTEGSNETE